MGQHVSERYQLVMGSKTWSSWSLRPWLLLHTLRIEFDETIIKLRQPDTAARISSFSPSGKVPVLIDRDLGNLPIWDTLAIVEHVADQHPHAPVWPRNPAARSVARSVSAEMHSGFVALRQNCPMDFNARGLSPANREAISTDVARILAIWADCRARFGFGGPFLFGAFSAADAMYAPVVSRFTSYEIDLSDFGDADNAAVYMASIRGLTGWAAWAEAAAREHCA